MATSILDELLAMERQVWEALVAGDRAADTALLAPDFLGVYPSGFADRANHASQLDAGPSVLEYRITQARAMPLADGIALLSYLAHYSRPAAPERNDAMYVTSIWRRAGHGWENIFSQDTVAVP